MPNAPQPRIMISPLEHYAYCPRQYALIHVEQSYQENVYNLRGNRDHDRVDEPETELRDDVRVERGLPLYSDALGLTGGADVVEFDDGTPFPIEYKHGEQREHRPGRIQLCAQALCLEEMLECDVLAGALYHTGSHLLRQQREAFSFENRTRRPPRDRLNAVLSFLYTLLCNDCEAAAEGVGLDPQIGFLHAARPGRPSLGLDLMEELRAPLADRLALTLVNRRQLTPGDFRERDGGAVLLNDEGRETVLVAYQERKQDTITHPVLDKEIELGLLPHAQARLLARHLRGDLDQYVSYLLR